MAKPVIVRRDSKGSSLSFTEQDTNFTNLQNATVSLRANTGGTLVTADLNGTITLVAGDNVTMTGNNTAKTITINAPVAGDTAADVLISTAGSVIADPAYLTMVGGTSGAQVLYVDTGITYSWVNDTLNVAAISATTVSATTVSATTANIDTINLVKDTVDAIITTDASNDIILKRGTESNQLVIRVGSLASSYLNRIETQTGSFVINTNQSGFVEESITLAGDGSNINLNASDSDGYVLISGGGVLRLLPITTTKRNNRSTVQDGMIIYNSTTNKFQGRANGSWIDLH